MAVNVMFGQLGRRRADRVFRERFSVENMTNEDIRRRYRFGKDSIKQIVELLDPIIGHRTRRSQALSTELQVHNWLKNLLVIQCIIHTKMVKNTTILYAYPHAFPCFGFVDYVTYCVTQHYS